MPFFSRLCTPPSKSFRFLIVGCLLPLVGFAQERPKLDVPYIPTPPAVVQRMLDFGQVGSSDYLIDLGSGDGRIPITAALERGARAFGVDIDPARIAESTQNALRKGVADRVSFKQQDLFETELSKSTVVTMYLYPEVNLKLRPHLLDTLKPGTRVVSHAFHMEDWTPDQHEVVNGNDVFLWLIPAKVAGLWQVNKGNETFVLRFWQQFQRIQGTASYGGERSIPLTDATLRGNEIRFTLKTTEGTQHFHGTLDDQGMRSAQGSKKTWQATRL